LKLSGSAARTATHARCALISMPSTSAPSLVVVEHSGSPFYEAKFRHEGRQVKRRLGPAWLDRVVGQCQRGRGRVPNGAFDERRAHAAATTLAAAVSSDAGAAADLGESEQRATRPASTLTIGMSTKRS
jgi:hypothetical protein